MPSSRFLEAARQIERAIDDAAEQSPTSERTRQTLRRELLEEIATWRISSRLRRLPLPWTELKEAFDTSGFRMAAYAYARSIDGISPRAAREQCNVNGAEARYLEDLARELGASFPALVRSTDPDVAAAVEADRESLHVYLDHRAVEDLLLATLESYASPPPGRRRGFTEVYGLCFGTQRRRILRDRAASYETVLHVSRIATQLRAKADADSVEPNDRSFKAQLRVANQFFRHLELLGDYHSHPYRDLATLRSNKGWDYSPEDAEHIKGWVEELREQQDAVPRFSLILAVAEGKRRGRGIRRETRNRVRVTIDQYHVLLAAYRIDLAGDYDDRIELLCPSPLAL